MCVCVCVCVCWLCPYNPQGLEDEGGLEVAKWRQSIGTGKEAILEGMNGADGHIQEG